MLKNKEEKLDEDFTEKGSLPATNGWWWFEVPGCGKSPALVTVPYVVLWTHQYPMRLKDTLAYRGTWSRIEGGSLDEPSD